MGLKTGDLKRGHVYQCILTGRNMLYIGHNKAIWYNDVKGQYEVIEWLKDGWLQEIPSGNTYSLPTTPETLAALHVIDY